MSHSKQNAKAVEAHTAYDERKDDDSIESKTSPSDSHLLLAPLLKYGLVAIGIVGLIVTITIVMNRDLSSIDEQVATAEDRIAALNKNTDTKNTKTNHQTRENIIAAGSSSIPSTTQNDSDKNSVTQPNSDASTFSTTDAPPDSNSMDTTNNHHHPQTDEVDISVSSNAEHSNTMATANNGNNQANRIQLEKDIVRTIPDQTSLPTTYLAQRSEDNRRELAIEHHNYIREQDKKRLETFKNSQDRQIEYLREQIAYQQQQLETLERRNLENYQLRESILLRKHERRQVPLEQM